MMDSISKLYAFSKMKPDRDGNFNLFQGSGLHCSKKMAEYTNCCRINMKGWGKEFGARCNKDEQLLANSRSKNLCVYVGKEKIKSLGVTTVVKHHFCCFGNMLDKVLQLQGRKQLGLNFGSGGSPNCRGLTLTEMQRIDWEQVDFTEFIEDFKGKFFGKYQSPNPDEIAGRVNSSMPGIRKGDDDPLAPPSNMTGWSSNIPDEPEE
jgi:conjugal transfer mating pair stabilization protein TraN